MSKVGSGMGRILQCTALALGSRRCDGIPKVQDSEAGGQNNMNGLSTPVSKVYWLRRDWKTDIQKHLNQDQRDSASTGNPRTWMCAGQLKAVWFACQVTLLNLISEQLLGELTFAMNKPHLAVA